MKKTSRSIVSLLLLLGILMTSIGAAHAAQIEPRYTGVSRIYSALKISEAGAASCSGSANIRSGYTADIDVELKRDGTTIKTWTSSGTNYISAGSTYFVTSGHSYVVTTTVTVYDSNGTIVESPSIDSQVSEY